MRVISVLATLLLAAVGAAAEPSGTTPAPAAAAARIETVAGAATDRAIERRLRGIFDEIDGLGDVRIAAQDGVVELSGETLSDELRERAVRLARQVQGVVEVEDRVAAVRDLRRRIEPVLDRLRARGADLVGWLPLLAVSALVVVLFWLLGALLVRWDAPFRRIARNQFLAELLQQVVRGAVVLVGVVIALDVLDATALVGTVLGAAGVLGLALGFALRDTVENYIASLLLSLRQPFGHDDLVRIEGFEGCVLRLTSRATVLMTLDGNHVRIPNAIVYKSIVVNYTRNPSRRFQFDVGVGADEDLAAVQSLGAATLARMNGILDDPPPMATVEALGDWAVVMRFSGWVDQRQADFLKVRSEAVRLVKQAFDAAEVTMPEPRYDVRIASGGTAVSPHGTAAAGKTDSPTTRGPAVAIDIAPQDHLDRQIRDERSDNAGDDLLRRDAPKE